MTSMTHHYFVTDTVPEFLELSEELPVIRDDRLVSGYIRMEQKSGLIGIYEKENPNAVWLDHCPWEAENELFTADYDRVMPWLENALQRMPLFAELGIKREVHGAISHPPDGNPLIGPAPGVHNYWCCCGTQIGIGWGPGLTRELANWMVHGAADISMREFDPRRFGGYATKDWQVTKAKEDYCLRHEIPFPHFNRLAGRPIKPSSLYERLKDKGAVFEEVYGHERPRWFAPEGISQEDQYSFRRNLVHNIVGQEVKAVRERVGIMDITAFAKVKVSGPDAAFFVDQLIPNRLPSKSGRIALTHLLNSSGRIELETTLVRIAHDTFYFTCAAFFEQRLLDHLNTHTNPDYAVAIDNLSNTWSALTLNGPKSRAVLAACSTSLLDNKNFPWFTFQQIEIAQKQKHVWAMRLSYAGESGWEIHCPNEDMLTVYDALWAAGESYGITDYGSFAMNVMRMEKAFKGASELTNEVTLPEADVMRFVRLDKDNFIGKTATQERLNKALPWICVYLTIEPDGDSDGHGGEAVLMRGQRVGSTSSITYGHTVGQILAFAYVKPEAAQPDTELEVIIMGKPRKARVLGQPAYDPNNVLPRADA